MSKCIICKEDSEKRICRHCVAKMASQTGKAIKTVGSALIMVGPVVISVLSNIQNKSDND